MISINNISKWYGDFRVLTDCSTQVEKGEVVVVCGPSGSGKSTLIKCVNGLEPVQQGSIQVEGTEVTAKRTDLTKLRSRIGMVFQHFELYPHMSVRENLCLGQEKVLKRSRDEANAKAEALITRVGLSEHIEKFPGQLSGGQQQRVAISRALAMDPIAMLFDEPTSALDPEWSSWTKGASSKTEKPMPSSAIRRVTAPRTSFPKFFTTELYASRPKDRGRWSHRSHRYQARAEDRQRHDT